MKDKFMKFFYGRYGHDNLNYFLLTLSIILIVLFYITQLRVFYLLTYICLFYCLYRALSKKYYLRHAENERYLKLVFPFKQIFKVIKNNIKDKERKYYICPSCKQICRVPRNKGKIEINCPHCHNRFTRKS